MRKLAVQSTLKHKINLTEYLSQHIMASFGLGFVYFLFVDTAYDLVSKVSIFILIALQLIAALGFIAMARKKHTR